LPRSSASWSTLFDQLESIVTPLNITDYSLSQTTLEQVFLEFSRAVKMNQRPASIQLRQQPKAVEQQAIIDDQHDQLPNMLPADT
jgi:hypothetical protein